MMPTPDPAVLRDCPGRVPPLVAALDVGPEHVRQPWLELPRAA